MSHIRSGLMRPNFSNRFKVEGDKSNNSLAFLALIRIGSVVLLRDISFEMVAAQSHKSRHTMKRTRLIQIRAGDPSPARPPKASVE
jgi:hypothetical protein